MIKTPKFWYESEPDIRAQLLKPVASLYAFGRRHHYSKIALGSLRAASKIICVGNVTAGGAGKTPVAAALYHLLEDMGMLPALVSRGYGGALEGPVMVDAEHHTADDVGDEPLMLSQQGLKVWIGKNRRHVVTVVEEMSDVILLDDGYQNPSVVKDLHILVIDGAVGFGNGCLLPAGPLREKPAEALARADMVIIIGADRTGLREMIRKNYPDCNLVGAKLVPDKKLMARLAGASCHAFAGIGRPGKFFEMLRGFNIKLDKCLAFADHHPYRTADLEPLLDGRQGQKILTTVKDYVRLPAALHPQVTPIKVALHFDDVEMVKSLLSRKAGG